MGSTNHPAAGNMMELQWDEELATLAQRHADQCSFVHDCSDCRKVSRFRVGQNLLRDKSISNERPDWRFAIESWFREIKDYPNADNSAFWFVLLRKFLIAISGSSQEQDTLPK